MKIFIGSDHAGYELKTKIVSLLNSSSKYSVHDMGPENMDSVDYPDYADLVCRKLHGFSVVDTQNPQAHPTHLTDAGILICGTGQGMAIRANKFSHIRAALAWNEEIAKLSRDHNDANVLCLGARIIEHSLALKLVTTFLETPFAGGRHWQRLVKVNAPI